MYIYRFEPIEVSKPWGKEVHLWTNFTVAPVIKFIDAKTPLSLQNHNYKWETFHWMDSNTDSFIYTANEVKWPKIITLSVENSDGYSRLDIPPGMIHSIPGNTRIIEVSSCVGTTNRIYDFPETSQEPREYHLNNAEDALKYYQYAGHKNKPPYFTEAYKALTKINLVGTAAIVCPYPNTKLNFNNSDSLGIDSIEALVVSCKRTENISLVANKRVIVARFI